MSNNILNTKKLNITSFCGGFNIDDKSLNCDKAKTYFIMFKNGFTEKDLIKILNKHLNKK